MVKMAEAYRHPEMSFVISAGSYCLTDDLRRPGVPVLNLVHSAFFHSLVKSAPAKPVSNHLIVVLDVRQAHRARRPRARFHHDIRTARRHPLGPGRCSS